MTTNTALIEKREELKRRLAAGEYKTLVDIFLEWFDRLIRKVTRRTKPLPIWLIIIFLSLSLTLVELTLVYISGETTLLFMFTGASGGLGILGLFWGFVLAIAVAILMNQYIKRIFVLWRDAVLYATESMAGLDDFEDWLQKTCNWRLHFLVTIIAVAVFTPYVIFMINNQLSVSAGYGLISSISLWSMFALVFGYPFYMAILLSARLRQYDLKLFAPDPSSSEIISRLSSELGWAIYIVAAFAIIGLTSTRSAFGVVDPFTVVAQVLGAWLPIIALFALIQTSLSSIIRRAKWKTLNEIQAKVEKLQAAENFEDKETMEAINRLMHYHDRVKATRDSALDFRTYLSFINSLLLPLLAFLLGNLDLVLNLFARKP